MGRQINFYLHPDDYQDFEDLLKATGEIIFLPYFHFDGKVRTVETTIPVDLIKEGSRVYLVRKQDFKQIELNHIEKFGYWLVADNHLPVLHYDRCGFDNDKIIRGRLYFQPSFVNDVHTHTTHNNNKFRKNSEHKKYFDSVKVIIDYETIIYKSKM